MVFSVVSCLGQKQLCRVAVLSSKQHVTSLLYPAESLARHLGSYELLFGGSVGPDWVIAR